MTALWQDQLGQVDALRRQADALEAKADQTRCGIWASEINKRCVLDDGHAPADHKIDLDLTWSMSRPATPPAP